MAHVAQENRVRFFARLEMDPDDTEAVYTAYVFAKYGHREQERMGGERYFEHLRAVALIILDELGLKGDWELITTALLHDIREDTWLLSRGRVAMNFGPRVGRWVELLTKEGGEAYYRDLAASENWQVLLVKMSDRLHNVRTMGVFSKERRERYIRETREEFPFLAERLESLLPPEYRWMATYLLQKIFFEISST